MERSPEEQARAEVRFLQRVGLHLRVKRRHRAGRGGRGAALRCSAGGEAPAAPGGDRGDVGDQSAFGVCWAGPENNRLLWVEHPPPARSPPPGTAQPPASPPGQRLCAAVTALGEVGPCVGGCRTKRPSDQSFQEPQARGRQGPRLFDGGG